MWLDIFPTWFAKCSWGELKTRDNYCSLNVSKSNPLLNHNTALRKVDLPKSSHTWARTVAYIISLVKRNGKSAEDVTQHVHCSVHCMFYMKRAQQGQHVGRKPMMNLQCCLLCDTCSTANSMLQQVGAKQQHQSTTQAHINHCAGTLTCWKLYRSLILATNGRLSTSVRRSVMKESPSRRKSFNEQHMNGEE